MALDFPPRFPDAYRLPVIAVEATARATMIEALKKVVWSPGVNSIDRGALRRYVVRYLCVLAGSFAEQACLAVRRKQYPATSLDVAVEGFVALAQQHALHLNHPKIEMAWGDYDRFTKDTTHDVMQGEWHSRYLLEVPKVIAAITPHVPAPEELERDSQVRQNQTLAVERSSRSLLRRRSARLSGRTRQGSIHRSPSTI
jgi:hypothetical protein